MTEASAPKLAPGAAAAKRPLVPPPLLILAGTVSVQIGAAFATTLFDELGPGGTVLLRIGFGAAMLIAIWRPSLDLLRDGGWKPLLLFGVTLGCMNFSFYTALDYLPLGVCVTLEFLGPLTVAVVGSRRLLDLVWVAAAAAGVALLSWGDTGGISLVGVALALTAATFWALYILLSRHVGRSFAGGTGLALSMVVAALVVAPPGIVQGGADLLDPSLMAAGAAVGLLSSVIPYSFELEALRYLSTATFGVLMSLEPATAALAGYFVIGQVLSLSQVVAIVLVVIASIGATRSAAADEPLPPPEI